MHSMGKFYLVFYLTIIFSFKISAQEGIYNERFENIKGFKGIYYKSKADFINNEKADTTYFDIRKDRLSMYEVNPFLKDISNKEINRDIFAIITEKDTLINLRYFSDRLKYGKLLRHDSLYVLFYMPNHTAPTLLLGVTGYILSTASAHATPFIFTANSDKTYNLNKHQIEINLKRLKDKVKMEEFKNEKEYSLEVLLKYFQYFMANKEKLKTK